MKKLSISVKTALFGIMLFASFIFSACKDGENLDSADITQLNVKTAEKNEGDNQGAPNLVIYDQNVEKGIIDYINQEGVELTPDNINKVVKSYDLSGDGRIIPDEAGGENNARLLNSILVSKLPASAFKQTGVWKTNESGESQQIMGVVGSYALTENSEGIITVVNQDAFGYRGMEEFTELSNYKNYYSAQFSYKHNYLTMLQNVLMNNGHGLAAELLEKVPVISIDGMSFYNSGLNTIYYLTGGGTSLSLEGAYNQIVIVSDTSKKYILNNNANTIVTNSNIIINGIAGTVIPKGTASVTITQNGKVNRVLTTETSNRNPLRIQTGGAVNEIISTQQDKAQIYQGVAQAVRETGTEEISDVKEQEPVDSNTDKKEEELDKPEG